MNRRDYLPSAQFATIAVALAMAGGLVIAAQYVTKPQQSSLAVAQDAAQAAQDANWQQTLESIESQSGVPAPQAPDPNLVSTLLSEAQSQNLTDSLGKSLFINIADAKAQGLGDDEPTQSAIVSQAEAQVSTTTTAAYSTSDLHIIESNKTSLHDWGNAAANAFVEHPNANTNGLLLIFGYMLDYNDTAEVGPINQSGQDFAGLAHDLAALPVPQTLAPLDLELINDLTGISGATQDMSATLTDPVRGLSGLQEFESLSTQTTNVLTSLGKNLVSDGILFSKDEPGAAWSVLVASSTNQ